LTKQNQNEEASQNLMRKQQTPTTICHNDNKLHQLIFDFGKEEQRLYMEFVKASTPSSSNIYCWLEKKNQHAR